MRGFAAKVVLGWLLCSAVVSSAEAQQVSRRTLGVRWKNETPSLYFSARDLVRPNVREKIRSGLPQNLSVQVYAYRDDRKQPIAVFARSCRIVFDLWEESYRIHLEESGKPKAIFVRSFDEVLRRCLVVRGSPVGRDRDYRDHQSKRIYFAVLVEFNPISDATVKRIRRWLSRSGGDAAPGDAFFGSFVSLFVNNRIGNAERVLRFRSQPMSVPTFGSKGKRP